MAKNPDQRPRPSQWKFGGMTPLQVVKRVGKSVSEDLLSDQAAVLAYFCVLALFPLLLFVTSVLGYFAAAGNSVQTSFMAMIARVVPPSAWQLVSKTMEEVVKARSGGKVLFGLLAALWSASSGVSAMMDTLNWAYHVKETRSYLRTKLVALGLTIGLSVLVLASLVLVIAGDHIAASIARHVGFGNLFVYGWQVAQWPVILFALFLSFAAVYYFAPNLSEPHWTWISPGAAAGVVIWLAVSFALRVYLHYFNTYSATYGSLGAMMILLLWLYVSGFALLLGGEVNSAIAQAEIANAHPAEKPEMRHDVGPGFKAA
jgi:membrane protein